MCESVCIIARIVVVQSYDVVIVVVSQSQINNYE